MPKQGRPRGSKNKPLDHAEGHLTRCPKCECTSRTAYTSKVEQAFAGTDEHGHPYTHIIRRRTSCTDCGQHRIDRFYENRPQPPRK